ncbi:MAG: hypothetical protein HZA17_06090 [Nitrospirae bacterium]|nr:hypothetical protein [Nitrospirota bacterium]
MVNYYRCLIPRLNGNRIKSEFPYYLSLVKKGICGFIIFGGELEEVRRYVGRLQHEATLPLVMASDLERGLGQQLSGGTNFPPAMALGNISNKKRQKKEEAGKNLKLVRDGFRAVAEEALYAGINTIFAPVLDINTNPRNPIIATRAFGEDRETVSLLGCEMIKELQQAGVAACGKHFPGHGDTETDSHIGLPAVSQSLAFLKKHELVPFQEAVNKGVKLMMLGHLEVPAMEPSGIPVSLSEKAVSFLREKMNYRGIIITDAMNMGGIGRYSEEAASFMALEAGVDIILHPSDPDKTAEYLLKKGAAFDERRLNRFRKGLAARPVSRRPAFYRHTQLSEALTEKSITVSGDFRLKNRISLIILNDEKGRRGDVIAQSLRSRLPSMKVRTVTENKAALKIQPQDDISLVVAVFSETRGWKGGAGNWLYRHISDLKHIACLFISFGSPYLLDSVTDMPKIFAYWDSESAQKAVADIILGTVH